MKALRNLTSTLVFLLAGSLTLAPVLALAQITSSPQAGELINLKGTVYYVTPTGLLGFTSPKVFYSWDYNFSQVVPASSAEAAMPMLGLVPQRNPNCTNPADQVSGTCAGSAGGIQTGALINKGGTIYLVGTTGVYGFPTLNAFNSWGYNFSQIVPTTSDEAALPMLGLVPIMQSGCTSALNQINGNCSSVPVPVALPVSIQSLNPSSGPVGTQITITGSGFTATGNTINFGIGSFTGNSSSNGTTLTFIIPRSLAPYCAPGTACPQFMEVVNPNNYNVNVINANGTSNSLAFTVTSNCPNNAGCPPTTIPLATTTPSTTTPTISVTESPSTVQQSDFGTTDGGSITISWNVQNMPANSEVTLWLPNSGLIDTSTSPSGSYTWQVPGPQCNSNNACVGQTDSDNAYYSNVGSNYIKAELVTPANSCWGYCPINTTPTILATSNSNTFTIMAP